MKTQTIAGHNITLEAGTRYIASRPIMKFGRKVYPVWIRTLTGVKPIIVVDNLTYDEADTLVNAFNNGPSSFEGRVW